MKYSLKYRLAARKARLKRALKGVMFHTTTIGQMCRVSKLRRELRR